jgi:hypothetical protein
MTYIIKKCALYVSATFNYQSVYKQKNNLNQFELSIYEQQ